MLRIELPVLFACRPFRNRAVGNGVMVVIVVGIVRVVMQRPYGVGRDPMLELFDLELSHVVPPSFPAVSRPARRPPALLACGHHTVPAHPESWRPPGRPGVLPPPPGR